MTKDQMAYDGVALLPNGRLSLLNNPHGWMTTDLLVVIPFSGLYDKDNREIYEGDIMKQFLRNEFGSLSEFVGIVEFVGGCYSIHYSIPPSFLVVGDFPAPEIIGNIFETRNLIPENLRTKTPVIS